MNATEATRHHQENRRDLQQPLIVRVVVKAHRFSALVAATLITLLLVWVFAHEKIGISPGLTPVAAHMDTVSHGFELVRHQLPHHGDPA
jgi:hypothetical protein